MKPGPQTIKLAESVYIKAFPNKVTTIDGIIASDNQVVVRWTAKGTQKGEFEGVAPSNREFKITGISIFSIEHNKITEIWQVWDHLGLLEQIGEIRHTYAIH
jgi:predicted ester cyclase